MSEKYYIDETKANAFDNACEAAENNNENNTPLGTYGVWREKCQKEIDEIVASSEEERQKKEDEIIEKYLSLR